MIDSNKLRRRLNEVLRTDADLNAFCLDFFPDVHRRFASAMDRTQKVNLLLEVVVDRDKIVSKLNQNALGSGSTSRRSPTPDAELDWRSPFAVLRAAIAAVPVMKYALGVAGLAAVVATVTRGFGLDSSTATLGALIVVALMAVLIVLAVAARQSMHLARLAIVMTWAFVAMALCALALFMASFFFHWPRPLRCLVHEDLCTEPRPPEPPPRVSLGRLSMNVPDLIGRKEELRQLEEAWAGPARRQVVAVVAVGGQGKTTLVVNWLVRMKAAGYRGARRVFAWSFYHQGASNESATSSDEFLVAALKFFGDPKPEDGTPIQKAARLAPLVRRERSLLILDGVEPLQSPPNAREGEGVLRDGALAALLTDLAADNPGLVVVTSRARLADLTACEGRTLQTILLRPFSDAEGVELLKSLGVQGTSAALVDTVHESRGHPLTLSLLGHLLHDAYGGDVRRRSEVASVRDGDAITVHAQHVMDAYDRWLGPGREQAALRLLGLFDRAAPGLALKALRAEPAVPGLNESLVGLSDAAWNQSLSRLRRAGLVEPENAADVTRIDIHPLVRDHFGDLLKKESEAAWREGHARLYAWYAASVKEYPDTAEEMLPLYVAVWHGCQAGRYQEVFDEVYIRRIQRRGKAYAFRQLGTIGSELTALSGFFEKQWTRPVKALHERDRIWIMNTVGVVLSSLGMLEDAIISIQAALDGNLARKDWGNAALVATNLSGMQLALGQVVGATALARQSIDLADRSRHALWRISTRICLADVVHQAGQLEVSRRLFIEAEKLFQNSQLGIPFVHSIAGYYYNDLLLEQSEGDQVLRRAGPMNRSDDDRLLDIGFNHLSLGRAHTARLAAGNTESTAPAGKHLDQAISYLRQAGDQGWISHGLLHRAAFFRQTRNFPSATRDLGEALLIATRSHMRLYETDVHLERARLLFAEDNRQAARVELAQAQALIQATGYARRNPEAALLAQQLGGK